MGESIIGGIEAMVRDHVDIVTVGGASFVVGQSALAAMRDRAIYLTNGLSSMDEKKLLSIINMSQPLTFGTIEYDDGESSYVIQKSATRQTPTDKLKTSLSDRLKMAPNKIIDTLQRDFGLDRPVLLAMGEFVTEMIKRINTCLISQGKKPLDVIMIAPAIGELIPFVKSGLLEVSSIEDAATKWPASFPSLVSSLENIAIAKKCIIPGSTPGQIIMPGELPPYPVLPEDIIMSIDSDTAANNSTRDYVAAIIMRENKLTPHLVAIEEYNVQLAKVIQEYSRIMGMFFS